MSERFSPTPKRALLGISDGPLKCTQHRLQPGASLPAYFILELDLGQALLKISQSGEAEVKTLSIKEECSQGLTR